MGKKIRHLMLDLETLGNKPGAAIVAIGAVAFNMDGEIHENKFHQKITFESALETGKVNASTLKWWMKQSDESRDYLVGESDVEELDTWTVTCNFMSWLKEVFPDGDYEVWGNSIRFDNGLLEAHFEALKYGDLPWPFRNEIDARTIGKIDRAVRKGIIADWKGVAHNPLDDAECQVLWCTDICKRYNIDFDQNS